MTLSNQLPYLRLPSPVVYNKNEEWTLKDNDPWASTDTILLPPILPNNMPYSPPSSFCSSSPSSPDSLSGTTFPTPKTYSIQSLLNSGSELQALEQQDERLFQTNNKRKKCTKMSKQPRSHPPYQRPTPTSKGLRLFSKQVSDKVAQKGITTYNEVADELAAEIQHAVDQKNVRRRVYDALNVLMAMDIIAKDRKQIKWLGIPTTTFASSSHNTSVELEIKAEEARQTALLASVQKSSKALDETLSHLARLRELVGRNQSGISNSVVCPLPFFIVSSHQPIRAFDVSPDGKQALLDLNSSSCRIYQDTDILAKLWPTTTSL